MSGKEAKRRALLASTAFGAALLVLSLVLLAGETMRRQPVDAGDAGTPTGSAAASSQGPTDIPYCADTDLLAAMQATRGGSPAPEGAAYSWPGDDVSAAAASLRPGQTLLLHGGTYATQLWLHGLHGTPDAWITIAAAPSEEATLDGTGMNAPVMVSLDDCSYLRISGLSIANANGQDACGVRVWPGCDHLVLDRNRVTDVTAPDPSEPNHCANGILLFGNSATQSIHDVYLFANDLSRCQTGWAECVTVAGNARNVNVEANRIDDTGNIGIDFGGNYGYCPDPALDFPTDCIAAWNVVTNCRSTHATSYGIYVDGGQRIQLAGNTVAGCSGGIEVGAEQPQASEDYATGDIVVRGNTIRDCDEAALTIGSYDEGLGLVRGVVAEGNDCRNNGGTDGAILTLSRCEDVVLRENVFRNDGGLAAIVLSRMGPDLTRGITFDGNAYGNGSPADATQLSLAGQTYTSFEAWAAAAGEHTGTYVQGS